MRINTSSCVRWFGGHSKMLLGITAGLIVGGAGSAVVMASIPDGSGVIHACYRTNGALSIIDSATQTCGSNQTAITWNQTGPQGPVGPQGPAGSGGPGGFVPNLTNADFTGSDFRYRDLSNLDFHGSRFDNGSYSGTQITGSDIHGSNFSGTSLIEVQGANLNALGSNFSGATLGGQHFSLSGNFHGANFTDAQFVYGGSMSGDLTNANFTNAILNGGNSRIDLSSAGLTGTTWSNTTCPDGTNSDNDGGSCIGHL